MADKEKDENKGFTVKDRRAFAQDGSPREEDAPPSKPAPADEQGLPEIDFSTFVLSLATSAFYHLGQIPHPESQKAELNLPMAKQTIDILAMLAGKTRGNLSRDEEKLLDNLLYDLRLKYVEVAKR